MMPFWGFFLYGIPETEPSGYHQILVYQISVEDLH
jgi:hypothetical protein